MTRSALLCQRHGIVNQPKQAPPSTDIGPGDLVIALRNGQRSPNGFPVKVPRKGELYHCLLVYPMWYGLGIVLQELNARPYKGFFLYSQGKWWFRKVVQEERAADISFQELMGRGIGVGTPIRELEDA